MSTENRQIGDSEYKPPEKNECSDAPKFSLAGAVLTRASFGLGIPLATIVRKAGKKFFQSEAGAPNRNVDSNPRST